MEGESESRDMVDGVMRGGAIIEGQSGTAVLHDMAHRPSIDNM